MTWVGQRRSARVVDEALVVSIWTDLTEESGISVVSAHGSAPWQPAKNAPGADRRTDGHQRNGRKQATADIGS